MFPVPDIDPHQHPRCRKNIHYIPPWYDLPEDADPDTHNPWLITDSSTKQTPFDNFVRNIGEPELRRRIEVFHEWMRLREDHRIGMKEPGDSRLEASGGIYENFLIFLDKRVES